MMTSSPQRLIVFAICCSVAAASATGDSVNARDFRLPPTEIAEEPCRYPYPGDPQKILGPNPAHGSCLTALYSPVVPGAYELEPPASSTEANSDGTFSIPLASTIWLYILGIGMLVLAGFNSRKRPRHLPSHDPGGDRVQQSQHLQSRSKASRWSDE